MIRELRTERLLLREWRESDRDAWAAMNADPEVMEHFPTTLDREAADAAFDRFSARLADQGWGLWAVEHAGEFLGFTGLNPVGFDAAFAPAIEIGWRLRRESWGRGFATEAARAAVAYAFGELGLDGLVSFTTVGNLRSRAVMERIGMTHHPDEDFDHPSVPEGSPIRPHVLYRLQRPA